MIGEHVLGFVPGEPGPEHPFAILPRMPTPGAAIATAPQPAAAADDDLRAVLARIVQREESALRELYDASVGRVYGLALRITGRSDAAEEVASDVYVQVWRDAARYDSERARVLTWLLTICRSRALDFLRRREVTEPLPDDDELAEPYSAPANDPYRGRRMPGARRRGVPGRIASSGRRLSSCTRQYDAWPDPQPARRAAVHS